MAVFPPAPSSNIEWTKLTFGVTEVNAHVESTYTAQTAQWSPPKLVRDPYIKIHGVSPALNYGQQAFEGLKAYRLPSGDIAIFRPDKNASRLGRSAEFLGMPPIPKELFLESVRLAVGANAEFVPPNECEAALYIRPVLFGSNPQVALTAPSEFMFLVYVMPTGAYHGAKPVDALVLEDFDRAAPEGSGSYKVGGNYAPVFKFSKVASEAGYGIMLHLDSKTHTLIDEFTTSGFIGIKADGNSVTVVASESKSVLKSITVESTLQIAESYGWSVERRSIPFDELPTFTEVVGAGTAATLVPVRSISRQLGDFKITYGGKAGQDEPGPCTKKLLAYLRGIQLGREEDVFGWLDIVEAPSQAIEP